jgi:hypothetical protein
MSTEGKTKMPTATTSRSAALKLKIASMTKEKQDAYVELIYAKLEAKENVTDEESMLFIGIMIGGA